MQFCVRSYGLKSVSRLPNERTFRTFAYFVGIFEESKITRFLFDTTRALPTDGISSIEKYSFTLSLFCTITMTALSASEMNALK